MGFWDEVDHEKEVKLLPKSLRDGALVILNRLSESCPLTEKQVRKVCRLRNSTVVHSLRGLRDLGIVFTIGHGVKGSPYKWCYKKN